MIKFNKYNVRDTKTNKKARVHYSLDNRADKRPCVTIRAKDYNDDLDEVFPDICTNDSDYMTDYVVKSKVVLFENHELYEAARKHVEEITK